MARHDVLNRRRGAAIGHEHHLRRRRLQEGDGAQVRRRADAGVGKLELVRLRLGEGDDLAHGLGRQRVRADERQRRAGAEHDRAEVLDRIVGRAGYDAGADDHRDIERAERIAIGRRAGQRQRRRRAPAARPVLDHDRLAEFLLQRRGHCACDDVRWPARGEAHQECDGAARIGRGALLRLRWSAGKEGCEAKCRPQSDRNRTADDNWHETLPACRT